MDNKREKRTFMILLSPISTLTRFSSPLLVVVLTNPHPEGITSFSTTQLAKLLQAPVVKVSHLLVKTKKRMRANCPTTLLMMASEVSSKTNTEAIIMLGKGRYIRLAALVAPQDLYRGELAIIMCPGHLVLLYLISAGMLRVQSD